MVRTQDYLNDYRRDGFAVLRAVFPAEEVAAMADEAERIRIDADRLGASYRHGNVLYVFNREAEGPPVLRFVQWPAYFSEPLARYRTDLRLLAVVEPLIGTDLKQIINQVIWKRPGHQRTAYGYHQDSRFRRPTSAYRDLASSFVQTAIAIDPHHKGNGALKLVRGSHLRGELPLRADRSVYEEADSIEDLIGAGLSPDDVVTLDLRPGDVALWHPYTVHGSGPNLSDGDRRVYLNGYVRAAKCDRGEWAFREGRAEPLGEPALVQYEDLHVRPEPHYLDGPPHPFAGE